MNQVIDRFYRLVIVKIQIISLFMELSQEHFDSQILELTKRLDNMATKAELESIRTEMVTKADLQNQTKELQDYTDAVAASSIEAVDNGFTKIERKLENRDKRMEKIEKDVQQLKGALHLS